MQNDMKHDVPSPLLLKFLWSISL